MIRGLLQTCIPVKKSRFSLTPCPKLEDKGSQAEPVKTDNDSKVIKIPTLSMTVL